MNKFAKSILNYFAAFTETRFNFGRKIDYAWTDDSLTADLSVFPEFQKKVLSEIKSGKTLNISIKKNEYCIKIDSNIFKNSLLNSLNEKYDINFLKQIIDEVKENNTNCNNNIILGNSFRKYNLEFRNSIREVILDIQKEKIDELKNLYNFDILPISTFNPNAVEQEIYDKLQDISRHTLDPNEFIQKIKDYVCNTEFNLVMYDLFSTIRKLVPIIGLGSMYLFFHQIKIDESQEKYPLFLIEIEFQDDQYEIIVNSIRDIVIINVPAINTFGFDNILTTPRASRFVDANYYLNSVDRFLQVNYNCFNDFILEPFFKSLSLPNKPEIKYRIGFQIIQKENRKLLDYSELITHIDAGLGGKFLDFVKNYVSGNVYNTTDEVDLLYNEKYPRKSVQSLISTIPLNLNKPQKRILTALENEKNKIIVVDGPPGTGKSYTITAITYWANQVNKSIVISSHKKAALDVIERMLTDKFKQLHPQSKPSVLRLDDLDKGINSIQNTLSSPVLSAANNRVNQFNDEAVKKDIDNWKEKIKNNYSEFISKTSIYEEYLKKLLIFEQLEDKLKSLNIVEEDSIELTVSININWDRIKKLSQLIYESNLDSINLEQLSTLINKKDSLEKISEVCKEIKDLPVDINNIDKILPFENNVLEEFSQSIKFIYDYLKPDSLVFPDGNVLRFKFSKRLNLLNGKNKEAFENKLKQLKSIKFSVLLSDISTIYNKDKFNLTIKDFYDSLNTLKDVNLYFDKINLINPFKKELGFESLSVLEFNSILTKCKNIINSIDIAIIEDFVNINKYFSSLLGKLNVNINNLKSFSILFDNSEISNSIIEYLKLLIYLNNNKSDTSFNNKLLSDYYSYIHKETEYINDKRIKNLNNYTGDVERIKLSIQKGKRLKEQELDILLKNISCIISEPDIISKYFPMKEDSIDILVIDEASQVSIAESISLILRAKQVVIFGDELQYGAVSAVNVNQKYSTEYFKEILKEYSNDNSIPIDSNKIDEISNLASQEISEDDIIIEPIYKPEDGTVEWLKTFSIRTSTLNFAKAIKNYSTSLDVHFRSFPEIIDYSNEFFYRPNQIPLVINRIRTKPIKEVLRFLKVETKGNSGKNINIDEIEVIKDDIINLMNNGFNGTIGIITSFREQKYKTEELLNKELPDFHKLKRDNKLTIWFVGDVQGEERDIVYYSFVEDNKIDNADLGTIYPVIDGSADTIRSLKMQRLNVGFSRAKDTMVFVHSMPIEEYHKSRLGDALKFYKNLSDNSIDNYISDENIFGSPAEKNLYSLITQTEFYKNNSDKIKIIAQFPIGQYIESTYNKFIPKYRVDFLFTLSNNGKEKSLILEYDGVEYHTKNPLIVTEHNFSQEYLDYDIERQLELESYGYKFLRINKFNLRPKSKIESSLDVLNNLLINAFK
ncbi:MAG TPA: AAA domain-containing protein [Ignavibacteria bacterium]